MSCTNFKIITISDNNGWNNKRSMSALKNSLLTSNIVTPEHQIFLNHVILLRKKKKLICASLMSQSPGNADI